MGIVLAGGLTLFVWSLAWVTLAGGGGRQWRGGRVGSGGVHDAGSVSRADVNSCGWQVGPEINGATQASMESKKTQSEHKPVSFCTRSVPLQPRALARPWTRALMLGFCLLT